MFELKSATYFHKQGQDGPLGVSPPLPPVLPNLPSDFFYPFFSSDSARPGGASVIVTVVSTIIALALMSL